MRYPRLSVMIQLVLLVGLLLAAVATAPARTPGALGSVSQGAEPVADACWDDGDVPARHQHT